MAELRSCVVFVVCCILSTSPLQLAGNTTTKTYVINLDLPPESRWTEVAHDYRVLVTDLRNILSELVPAEVVPLVEKIAAVADSLLPSPYAEEIRGIAHVLGVSVGDVVIPNILYELIAHCTSIVAQDSNGHIWHGRNLDYSFTEIVKNITITVHYQKNGKTLYTGTTFAGYVGLLTGQKHGVFTVSADERDNGDPLWYNALTALLERNVTLMTFSIRDALEKETSFKAAVNRLAYTPTPAPVYFIIGGAASGEGAVITKDRVLPVDIWYLNVTHGRWFLVETNYDHWKPVPHSDDRRGAAIKAMQMTGQTGLNTLNMFKVMSTHPVLNPTTMYTTIMSAAQPDVYSTWIRH